jgi:hypothetical protein
MVMKGLVSMAVIDQCEQLIKSYFVICLKVGGADHEV